MSHDEWKPVVGFEKYYLISKKGELKSLHPTVRTNRPGGLMTPRKSKRGYVFVDLRQDGSRRMVNVGRLVAEAFIPNPNNYPLVRHLNDVKDDNRVENLAWGTTTDNSQDAVRNKVHPESRKTHCPQGHPYNQGNTKMVGRNRQCRACQKDHRERMRREGIPEGDPRHGTETVYATYKCRCHVCVTAKKNGTLTTIREVRRRRDPGTGGELFVRKGLK